MFALQNAPAGGGADRPGGLEVSVVEPPVAAARFDLTFSFAEDGRDLAGVVDYATDLFDAATIARWIGHLETFARAAVADPSLPMGELPRSTAAEHEQAVATWAASGEPGPPFSGGLFALCARQAERTPEAEAVAAADGRLTYGLLLARARRLGKKLAGLGVGAETRVAVVLDRSVEMPVAVLGVLAAGGAYVPFDPASPGARLAELFADAGIGIVLTRRALLPALAPAVAGSAVRLLGRDDDAAPADEEQVSPNDGLSREVPTALPGQLAYVIYTSGSTGGPKGVVVAQRR